MFVRFRMFCFENWNGRWGSVNVSFRCKSVFLLSSVSRLGTTCSYFSVQHKFRIVSVFSA